MLWTTEIKALNREGELVTFRGPIIKAESWELAQNFCENNGLGYIKVTGRFEYYRTFWVFEFFKLN